VHNLFAAKRVLKALLERHELPELRAQPRVARADGAQQQPALLLGGRAQRVHVFHEVRMFAFHVWVGRTEQGRWDLGIVCALSG
jgi:hypothetical protein